MSPHGNDPRPPEKRGPVQPTAPDALGLLLGAIPGSTTRPATDPAPICKTQGCGWEVEGVEVTAAIAAIPATDTVPEIPGKPARIAYLSLYCEGCVQEIQAAEKAKASAAAAAAVQAARLDWWRNLDAWGGVAGSYHRTQFDKIPNQEASAKVLKWHLGRYPKPGLLITGSTGQGKTRSVYLLLKQLLLQEGIRPEVWKCITLRGAISTAARSDDPNARARFIRTLYSAPVLFLDDLGQMASTDTATEAALEIVEECTARGVPIIATTQFSGKRLIETFKRPETGQAISRRLEDFCEIIHF